MKDVILHNPRCSKSRGALEILVDEGVEIPIREYLRDPLTVDELRELTRLLGVRPIDITRTGESRYRELKLRGRDVPDEEMLTILATNPILIERPIVVRHGRAVVGRPPKIVRDLL